MRTPSKEHQLHITGWGNIGGCAALYWASERGKCWFDVGLCCDGCVSPWAAPLVDTLSVSGGAQVSMALYPLLSYSWQTPADINTHRETHQAGKPSHHISGRVGFDVMFTTFSSSGTHRWLRSLCSALAQLVLLISNFSLYLKPATTYRDTHRRLAEKKQVLSFT